MTETPAPAKKTENPINSLMKSRDRARQIVESKWFVNSIIAVITLNAITLGLETSPAIMSAIGVFLEIFDKMILGIFIVELSLKLYAYGWRFFKSGWNVFDFIIVAIALSPASGAFSVLRALRILRALRLVSAVPKMRNVIEALLSAVPGMGAIIAVLTLIFYIAAVMSTKMFGEAFPEWFGTIGASMYSLFQIMTLESWSMGIVRPVMEQFPLAWIFFVPFIVITSFAVLNLFIALIVNSMQTIHDDEEREHSEKAEKKAHAERDIMLEELRSLKAEVQGLRRELDPRRKS